MRTLTLVCTLLLLTSCVDKKANQRPPAPVQPARAQVQRQSVSRPEDRDDRHLFGTDESSPIIISDGSIKVEHHLRGSHFRVHGKDHAVLKLPAYELNQLGFGCDPTTTGTVNLCSSINTLCALSNKAAACKLAISPKSNYGYTWALDLCETPTCASGAPVTLSWDSKGRPDYERIDIRTTGTFTLGGADATGPVVKYVNPLGITHLQSARLTVTDNAGTPTTYDFDLTGPNSALELSYECNGSGNTCRPEHQ